MDTSAESTALMVIGPVSPTGPIESEAAIEAAQIRDLGHQIAAAKQINYDLRKQLGDADRKNSALKSDVEVLQMKVTAEKNDNIKLQEHNKNLEAEIKRVRQETARQVALKNLNDDTKVGALEVQLEGRKVAYAQLAAEMEKLEEESQKDREQLTTQLMMLQDENVSLKENNKASAANQRTLEENLRTLQSRFSVFLDRSLMAKEDKLSTEIRAWHKNEQLEKERKKIRRESVNLQSQLVGLQAIIVNKDIEIERLQKDLTETFSLNATLTGDSGTLAARISEQEVTMKKKLGSEREKFEKFNEEMVMLRAQEAASLMMQKTMEEERLKMIEGDGGQDTLLTHPINPPYHTNPPYQPILLTHPLLSTHPMNPPYQPTLFIPIHAIVSFVPRLSDMKKLRETCSTLQSEVVTMQGLLAVKDAEVNLAKDTLEEQKTRHQGDPLLLTY